VLGSGGDHSKRPSNTTTNQATCIQADWTRQTQVRGHCLRHVSVVKNLYELRTNRVASVKTSKPFAELLIGVYLVAPFNRGCAPLEIPASQTPTVIDTHMHMAA